MQYTQNEPIGGPYLRTAIILCGSKLREDSILNVASICNIAVLEHKMFDPGSIDANRSDLVLIDLPSIMEIQRHTLSDIARYLDTHRNQALVWTNMELLEEAYALFPVNRCHYLVNANDLEAIPYLTGAIRRGKMDQLHDNSRDSEFGALHRISEELSQFARTLSRIAEADDNGSAGMVSDKPVSFRPASAGAFEPFTKPTVDQSVDTVTATSIREIIKLRRMRDNHFKPELFADPAWDILLDLLAARLEGKTVSVSSLCIAAAVPPTTALRWVTGMTESGMLVRRHDPNDARRVFIELSIDTVERLMSFFSAAKGRTAAMI